MTYLQKISFLTKAAVLAKEFFLTHKSAFTTPDTRGVTYTWVNPLKLRRPHPLLCRDPHLGRVERIIVTKQDL